MYSCCSVQLEGVLGRQRTTLALGQHESKHMDIICDRLQEDAMSTMHIRGS